MTPMALSMVHGTDAISGTNNRTKGHIIPLKNHLIITNAMVSLIGPSASCNCNAHDKTNMSSNATHKLHMPISQCPHRTLPCQYICLISTHCNQQCEHELWHIHILHYWHMTLNKHAYKTVHMFPCTYTVVYI